MALSLPGAIVAGGALQAGGSIVSSALGLSNQRDVMNWEERMSNTSWQRSVADMRAAGINPLLAVMKGGASTPSVGNVQPNIDMRGLADAIVSASQYKLDKQRVENETSATRAQVDKMAADIALIKEQIPKVQQDVRVGASQELLNTNSARMVELKQAEQQVYNRLWRVVDGVLDLVQRGKSPSELIKEFSREMEKLPEAVQSKMMDAFSQSVPARIWKYMVDGVRRVFRGDGYSAGGGMQYGGVNSAHEAMRSHGPPRTMRSH